MLWQVLSVRETQTAHPLLTAFAFAFGKTVTNCLCSPVSTSLSPRMRGYALVLTVRVSAIFTIFRFAFSSLGGVGKFAANACKFCPPRRAARWHFGVGKRVQLL